jgi:hypothetical protein
VCVVVHSFDTDDRKRFDKMIVKDTDDRIREEKTDSEEEEQDDSDGHAMQLDSSWLIAVLICRSSVCALTAVVLCPFV